MTTFDAMSREVCTAKREVTSTPLHALVLLNDPQFVEAARTLAERLMQRFPTDGAARNAMSFRALLARVPDRAEAEILRRLFDEQRALFAAPGDDAARLLRVGESRVDESLPPAELAAMTMVVSAILNFEEFVVLR